MLRSARLAPPIHRPLAHSHTTAGTPMDDRSIPTLYEWAGGEAALTRLFTRFYQRVPDDPVLGPIFARMDPAHAVHVAAFVGEVFGGPKRYTENHGGHPHM